MEKKEALKMFSSKKVELPLIQLNNNIPIDICGDFCPRLMGSLMDSILKDELLRLNNFRKWHIFNGQIKNSIERGFDLTAFDDGLKDRIANQVKWQRSLCENINNKPILENYFFELLKNTDAKLFKAKRIFMANISFVCHHDKPGEGSKSKIKPDLIIDNKLIDIKNYETVKVSKSDLVQLITYAIWLNNIDCIHKHQIKSEPSRYIRLYKREFKITEISIYFSRHSYLWKMKLYDILTAKDKESFRIFCENNSGKHFKTKLQDLVKRFVEIRFGLKSIHKKVTPILSPVEIARKKYIDQMNKYNEMNRIMEMRRNNLISDKDFKLYLNKLSTPTPPTHHPIPQ